MRTVSIVSIVYGTLGLIWGVVVTVIIKVQQAIFEDFTFPDEVYDYLDISSFLDSIYGIMGTLFPFVFLIAVIYILSGILQLSGNSSFRSIAFIAAILNIVWYAAYAILILMEVMPLINSLEMVPAALMNVIVIIGMLVNIGIYCAYPIFLLFYLRKGRELDTLDTGYRN